MSREAPFRILIAGGGVAAVEAMLALRPWTSRRRAEVELLTPATDLVHRPLSVAEPFGRGQPIRIPLARVVADCHATHRRAALASVRSERREALTVDGEALEYDALLLAIGARPSPALPGALSYRGLPDAAPFRRLLRRVRRGSSRRVLFTVPTSVAWALPLYELALLTAAMLREEGVEGVAIGVVTHEPAPLAAFGPSAGEAVAGILAEHGVELRTEAAPSAVVGGKLRLAGGASIPADEVVALPELAVAPLPGVPQGPRGFIPTDRLMEVEGAPRVYAAGDATWFPIKQGGLAAQQAEVAAGAIATRFDRRAKADPFRPILRAALLTGSGPFYLRAAIGDEDGATFSSTPLWWPPSKVAGHHLASYLRGSGSAEQGTPLVDLEPPASPELDEAEADHREAIELALSAADADAREHDFRAAVRWLEIAADLDLTLSAEYAAKREHWRDRARISADEPPWRSPVEGA